MRARRPFGVFWRCAKCARCWPARCRTGRRAPMRDRRWRLRSGHRGHPGRGRQARAHRASARRSGAARGLGNQMPSEPVAALALAGRFRWRGQEPAHLSRAVALGPGAAAQPPRRLHARLGFDSAAARGRQTGRCERGPHARGFEAVPAAAARRALGGEARRAVLAAARQRTLHQQPHRLHPRAPEQPAAPPCVCG